MQLLNRKRLKGLKSILIQVPLVLFSAELVLKPVAPFNFDLSAQIFGNGDRQIRIYENGKFRQIIRLGSKLALLNLNNVGSVDQPALLANLKSNRELSRTDTNIAENMVNRLFNLELDLAPFYAVAKHDKVLKEVAQRLKGLRSPTTPTVYEALMDSIIEQQISLKVATKMERQVIKRFGQTFNVDGIDYYTYPTPQALARASVEELRECGLSGRKAEYLREISTLVVLDRLDLEIFRSYAEPQKIVRELDAVRGIGTWTAELTVIRALQKWDVMPADDVGLRRILSQYYCEGERITSEQARKIAKPWGRWRGLAAFYFVVADMLNVKVEAI